jgi:hypothetical protein
MGQSSAVNINGRHLSVYVILAIVMILVNNAHCGGGECIVDNPEECSNGLAGGKCVVSNSSDNRFVDQKFEIVE